MRARVLLWVCLGLNLLLAGMIMVMSRDALRQSSSPNIVVRAKDEPRPTGPRVVVRRQHFTWSEVESPDYVSYIQNLRRSGCPEKTIRDIIVADVTELFAERILKEVQLPEQKWWLPEPDRDALEEGMKQIRALQAERDQLLTSLLGPEWNKGNLAAASATALQNRIESMLRFDGPVLGGLPTETKSRIEEIESNARTARAQLLEQAATEAREPTAAELSRVDQEARRQLASILTPEQLEEYLLRYSATAEQMRDQLRGFGASAEEFRRIFRLRDSFEQQVAELAGDDRATLRRRAEIERMQDEALRQEIGPERFTLYKMTEDPLFRAAQLQAEQKGAPPEKVLPLFAINQATQEELARISSDETLSEDQRRIMIVTVQQQQQNSIERVLANLPAEQMLEATQPEPEVIRLPPLPPGIYIVPEPR